MQLNPGVNRYLSAKNRSLEFTGHAACLNKERKKVQRDSRQGSGMSDRGHPSH